MINGLEHDRATGALVEICDGFDDDFQALAQPAFDPAQPLV